MNCVMYSGKGVGGGGGVGGGVGVLGGVTTLGLQENTIFIIVQFKLFMHLTT